MRWSRGYPQVFRYYGKRLIKGMLCDSFPCFDMLMTIMPAFILSMFSVVSNITLGVWGAYIGDDIRPVEIEDIARMNRLMTMASVMSLIAMGIIKASVILFFG